LKSAQTVYKQDPDKPALAMDYAKALLHNGQYEQCLKALGKTTVLPYEGAGEGHDLYRQAHLFSAALSLKNKKYKAAIAAVEKAKLWPENLGVGKPFDVDERLENFLAAAAADKAGDRKRAEELYKKVCADAEKFKGSRDAVQLLSAIAFRKTGEEDQVVRLLEEWRSARGGEDPVYGWAAAWYRGDMVKANVLLTALKRAEAGWTWDMGTGDRHFPLVRAIVEAARK